MDKKTNYIFLTIILLIIELFIGMFINDSLIRPYLGDILVMPLIFCFFKIFIKGHYIKTCLITFLIGITAEFLQLLKITEFLGISKNSVMGIILGSTFDLKDIFCYLIGSFIILFIYFIKNYKSR